MKRNIAVIVALVIGACCCSGRTAMAAEQKEEIRAEEAGSRQDEYILGKGLPSEKDWAKEFNLLDESVSGDPKMNSSLLDLEGMKTSGKDSEKADLSGDADDKEGELAGGGRGEKKEGQVAKTLQMPQRLEVTIDPWKVDGKEQVHSEQYVIRNTGEVTGELTLSELTCRPLEGSGVSVRTDRHGIHEDEKKSIYMEIIFGTGERIVLSEEGSEYKTELKPGEEVTLEFTGEVNEHASRKWDNRDVAVGIVYSWELEEEKIDKSGDATADESGDVEGNASSDVSGDAAADESGDVVGDMSGDVSENESGNVSGDATADGSRDASGDVSGDAVADKSGDVSNDISGDAVAYGSAGDALGDVISAQPDVDVSESVDIDLSGDAELRVDSWTADENGNLTSIRYVMRNKGNVLGMLKLTDPVCSPVDQNGTIARMKLNSREKPQSMAGLDSDDKLQNKEHVWFELTTEDVEKADIDQENPKASEYETVLNPGEEIVICFLVSPDTIMAEELKEGKTVAAIRYSWKLLKESMPEL